MKRKDFLKTLGVSLASLPLLGFKSNNKKEVNSGIEIQENKKNIDTVSCEFSRDKPIFYEYSTNKKDWYLLTIENTQTQLNYNFYQTGKPVYLRLRQDEIVSESILAPEYLHLAYK